MHDSQAGPGEIAHLAGDLVGVEVLATLDEAPAGALGEADERVGDRAPVLGVDVDRDQGAIASAASAVTWRIALRNSSSRRVPPPYRS